MSIHISNHSEISNRHRRAALAVVLLVASTGIGTGKLGATPLPPRALTVEQAVELALAHSPVMAARVAATAAEDARAAVARTARYPGITLSAGYQRVAAQDPLELDLGPGSTTLGDEITDVASVGVTVQQPLFTGGAIAGVVALAEVSAQIRMHELVLTRRDVIHRTRAAYWEVVEAQERLQAIRDRLAQVHSLVRDSENRAAAGVLTRSDLLAVRMSAAETEMQELRARNTLDVALARLRTLTGLDAETPIEPVSDVGETVRGGAGDLAGEDEAAIGAALEDYVARALSNRSDLAALRLAVVAQEESLRSVAAERFPQLSAIGSVSYASPAPNEFPADSSFGTTWSVGITGRYELGNQPRTGHSIRAAREDRSAAEAQLRAAEEQVALEVRMNYLEWQTAAEEVLVARTIVAQAEENLQETRTRIASGTALRTDELDAEARMLEARLALTSARIGRVTAWETLLRSTGELE